MQVNDLVKVRDDVSNVSIRYLGSGKIVSIDGDDVLVVFDHNRNNLWIKSTDLVKITSISFKKVDLSEQNINVTAFINRDLYDLSQWIDIGQTNISNNQLRPVSNSSNIIVDSLSSSQEQQPRIRRARSRLPRAMPRRSGGIPVSSNLSVIRERGR